MRSSTWPRPTPYPVVDGAEFTRRLGSDDPALLARDGASRLRPARELSHEVTTTSPAATSHALALCAHRLRGAALAAGASRLAASRRPGGARRQRHHPGAAPLLEDIDAEQHALRDWLDAASAEVSTG